MTEIGPVQMIAVGFEQDANFEGRIMDELIKLQGDARVRSVEPQLARLADERAVGG